MSIMVAHKLVCEISIQLLQQNKWVIHGVNVFIYVYIIRYFVYPVKRLIDTYFGIPIFGYFLSELCISLEFEISTFNIHEGFSKWKYGNRKIGNRKYRIIT